jgi:hypothetical protein
MWTVLRELMMEKALAKRLESLTERGAPGTRKCRHQDKRISARRLDHGTDLRETWAWQMGFQNDGNHQRLLIGAIKIQA